MTHCRWTPPAVIIALLLAWTFRGVAAPMTTFAGYAGSASCETCHQEEYKLWQTSNHGLAERAPSSALDQKAFVPPRSFGEGFDHASVRLDGTNFLVTGIGLTRSNETHEILRVIGNNPLRQFLVTAPGNRLQTLEAAYDPVLNEWFNVFGHEDRQPGEWGHWTGRGMNWNSMCAACHNTRLQKNYDPATDSYHTTIAERSVGCESCHGPMQAHVDWQHQSGKGGQPDPTLAKFTRVQVMDNCAYCHSRRSELDGDFKPGDAFFDHASLTIVDASDTFYPDGQIHDEDYELTAFYGSHMHAAGVTCLDCHNPHSEKTLLPGNQLCLRCHNGSYPKAPVIDPVQHSHHQVFGYTGTNHVFSASLLSYDPKKISQTGGECVNCHMPQTVYMQRHGRHDHGFTIPDPLLTREIGTPNACNRCHTDKSVDWALTTAEKWYGEKMNRPSRARAETIALARQNDPAAPSKLLGLLNSDTNTYWQAVATGLLGQWADQPPVKEALLKESQSPFTLVREQAVHALEPQIEHADPESVKVANALLTDPLLNTRLAAAWTLRATLPSNAPAAYELQQYLAINADQPMGQAQLGAFNLARGNLDQAAAHYAQAVAWDSHAAPFHHDLAIVLSMQGKDRAALDQLQSATRLAPNDADYEFKLGLAWAGVNDLPHAADALQKATDLDPHHPRAWFNLGIVLQSLGQSLAALDALQRAEAVSPDDAQIPYAEATILARLGRASDAAAAANRALKIDPAHAGARQLLQFLSPH